jgi:hypothetical protein
MADGLRYPLSEDRGCRVSTGKTSVLGYLVCFVVGSMLSAGVVHKVAASKLKGVQAELDAAVVENAALKERAVTADTENRELKVQLSADRSNTATKAVTDHIGPEVAQAMELVRSHLKDPSSAVFGPVKIAMGVNGKVACGTVNARNSFGGFTGMQQFSVDFDGASRGDEHAVAINDAFATLAWMTTCAQ